MRSAGTGSSGRFNGDCTRRATRRSGVRHRRGSRTDSGRTPAPASTSGIPTPVTPMRYAEPRVLRPHLQDKLARCGSKLAIGLQRTDVSPKGNFRWTTRGSRSAISRAPPTRGRRSPVCSRRTAAVHQAPLLVRRQGDEAAEAFLLGVMSSIPFDWATRRWVELHLTFELLNALPVPRYDPTSAARAASRGDRRPARGRRRPLRGLGGGGRRSGWLGEARRPRRTT